MKELYIELRINHVKESKKCLLDWIKGRGTMGSPFSFKEYGLEYNEIKNITKISVELRNFLFDLGKSEMAKEEKEKVKEFLKECLFTEEEIMNR